MYIITNRRGSLAKGFGSSRRGEGFGLFRGTETKLQAFRAGKAYRRQLMADLTDLYQKTEIPPSLVLVVHGYNVTWEDSLRRAREVDQAITQRLPGGGVTVGFSWANSARALLYLKDRVSAVHAGVELASLLREALRITTGDYGCRARVLALCHSMGNHVFFTACSTLWRELHEPKSVPLFAETALIAANVDGNDLEAGRYGYAVPILSRRVTVYSSRADRALAAADTKELGINGPQLGRQGVADLSRVASNVVAVDCTEVSVGVTDPIMGAVGPHSSYFYRRRILDDLRATMAGQDRSLIPRTTHEDGSFSLNTLEPARS